MNTNAIASDKSWEVYQKIRAERDGRDVPKVKAPTERPSRFDALPVIDAKEARS